MATRIVLQHKETGFIKNGYYGFSWTTLFFGFMPALFRGDFITFFGAFAVMLIIGLVTVGFGTFFVSLA
ncbi:hypothetical protein [Candidatus Dactylopiibacterium carminicum]|uniref:hypothetical protein n=1 Tax=Candidatus Dactylopiibacterium carminicum TaxID=857335 RepID=UPI001CC2AD34|nr:hypothetical protein [Candidatus Dactylopiibacterium carminicum]